MIKFSVIMPVYNSEKTLKRSIDSILAQTYKNWELIIVDDGSTDSSLEILTNYSEKDRRIKVLSQMNSGPGIARNYGISKATGEYIAFIDSDDYYDVDYLQLVNNKIENNSNLDLVFVSSIHEYEDGRIFHNDELIKFSKYEKEELIKFQMVGNFPWGPCSKVVKVDIVKQCLFDNFSVGEESLYSFKILNLVNNYDFVDKALYHYVYNYNGQHTKGGIDPWFEISINMKKYLIENDLINRFYKSLNTLALKSCMISIYRIAYSYSYFESKSEIKKQINKYKNIFDFEDIDTSLLDFSTKLIFFLANLHFYFIIIFISKFRNLLKKK